MELKFPIKDVVITLEKTEEEQAEDTGILTILPSDNNGA